MHTRPVPIARTLVFLCVGALSGLVTLPYTWSWSAFFLPGLFAGPGLAVLLGVHLWRQPQRTPEQIAAVCLSPLIAGIAYILALLVIGIIYGGFEWAFHKSGLIFTYISGVQSQEEPSSGYVEYITGISVQASLGDWLLGIAECFLLAAIFALGGVAAASFIARCLSPLLRSNTRRVLILSGAVNGLLLLPCMLVGAWYISRHPDLAQWDMSAPGFDPLPPPPEWTHNLMYFVLKPQIGPFLPIAFGLFAAVLGWVLPVPAQGKTDAN